MYNISTKLLTLLTIFVASLCLPANASVLQPENAEWKVFPAFDAQPVKIMDGPRYTYFYVRQAYFHPDKTGKSTFQGAYNSPASTVLYFDKNGGDGMLHPITEKAAVRGLRVVNAEYNPAGSYLMMVYENGRIEVVTDSGSIYKIDDFAGRDIPFATKVYSINYVPGSRDAWLGTAQGFIHIDGNDFSVKESPVINARVISLAPVGDQLIAVIETYTADETGQLAVTGRSLYKSDSLTPSSLSDFSNLGVSNSDLNFVMPLNDKSFAVMTSSDIRMFTRTSSGYEAKTLASDNTLTKQLNTDGFVNNNPGGKINFRTYLNTCDENNRMYLSNGYMIISDNYAYNITRGDNPACTSKKFAKAEPTWVGSYDFSDFWFFEEKEGFCRRTGSGSADAATWGDSRYVEYSGPAAMEGGKLLYSPKYGMLVRNNDLSIIRSPGYMTNSFPLLLSAYRNGKWTNLSPLHNRQPALLEGGFLYEDYDKRYRTQNHYPMCNPIGACLDSRNPDYLFLGSTWHGVAALNLGNVSGPIMRFNSSQDPFQRYGVFKAEFKPSGWGSFNMVRPMGVDNAGNVWVYLSDPLGYEQQPNTMFLYYWTPEARDVAQAENNIAKAGAWQRIEVPVDGGCNGNYTFGTVLNHPSNANKLVVAAERLGHMVWVVDHNGTIADRSDDHVHTVRELVSPDGSTTTAVAGDITTLVENPATGELVVGSLEGLQIINVTRTINGNTAVGEDLCIKRRDGSKEYLVKGHSISAVCFDEYNRLWFASRGSIKCVNPDRTEVVVEYNQDNSPIPSDLIFDICWNPDTKELMAVTSEGIVSVRPDLPSTTAAASKATQPYVYPAVVSPGTIAEVALHNAPANAIVEVFTADGEKVADLYNNNGVFVWDTLDASGRLVPSGRYIVRERTNRFIDLEVTVLR